jgi:hypothetical protein
MIAAVGIFLLLMGLGIAGIWTKDILGNPEIDLGPGFFKAREPGSGSLFWPHWFAEYATAGGLVAGGIALLLHAPWAIPVALLADGALLYTSLNALGWAFAKRERLPYAIPMLVGLAGGLFVLLGLLVF